MPGGRWMLLLFFLGGAASVDGWDVRVLRMMKHRISCCNLPCLFFCRVMMRLVEVNVLLSVVPSPFFMPVGRDHHSVLRLWSFVVPVVRPGLSCSTIIIILYSLVRSQSIVVASLKLVRLAPCHSAYIVRFAHESRRRARLLIMFEAFNRISIVVSIQCRTHSQPQSAAVERLNMEAPKAGHDHRLWRSVKSIIPTSLHKSSESKRS